MLVLSQVNERPLGIAIDSSIANSQQGLGTAVLSLAKALSDSKLPGQTYTFIVLEGMRDWLAPYVYAHAVLLASKCRSLLV